MPVDENGRWEPSLLPKQAFLLNVLRQNLYRYVLLTGPRLTGKTLGMLHAIVDHAWRTNPANVCIITITQSAGYDSGIWTDLTEQVLPEWVGGNFGMRWVRKPSISQTSKKPYCIVSNYAGRPVRFQLESLKNEDEVEARFKSKRYSCLCVNELSNFRTRKVLETWAECLRMIGLPPEQHFFIADTNPADEGTESWIYKIWFELKHANLDEDYYRRKYTQDELLLLKKLQPLLFRLDFTLADNTFIEPDRVEQLKAMLASNRDLYARYVEGKWVQSNLDALFAGVFRESVHVVGEPVTASNPNPLILYPEDTCYELLTGWDLGVVNSAAVIVEKVNDPDKPSSPIFKVLDELVILNTEHAMEDFVAEFVEKMKYWTGRLNRNVRWVHYSDRSAFDMREPSSMRFHHQLVYESSPPDTPGGPIELIGAARGRNSVRMRVDLLRKLLWEERIFFSAARTPNCIEMLKAMKPSRNYQAVIDRGNPHKHIFDALMYCVASECVDEVANNALSALRKTRTERDGFICIPI